MWRYTPVKQITITRTLLTDSIKEFQTDIPVITDEGLTYINEIYQPFLDRLNNIQTVPEIYEYIVDVGLDIQVDRQLSYMKEKLLSHLVEYLTWDSEREERGISEGTDIINPWIVRDYIRNHKSTRRLFNLPKHKHDDENYTGEDEDCEMTSVTFPVTIHGRDNLDIEYFTLLGVMAVYRHLHIMHPFSYKGKLFADEMEIVNNMAFNSYYYGYKVNVDDNIYTFQNINFFQGLITGAMWNNLNPHTFITNLQQEKKQIFDDDRISEAFTPVEKIWVDLNY